MSKVIIARIKNEIGKNEGIAVFDTSTQKVEVLKLSELRDYPQSIIGASVIATGLKIYQYFKPVGTLGADACESWTLVQRHLYKDNVKYLLVNTVGAMQVVSKEELIKKIKEGERIAGCCIINNQLRVYNRLDSIVK